ncbi:MAG TPA: esterase-like activity of phytase family protein [Sphingomonas sp.]|nr:esterase-like activity of phytase family protein [Sphingomonas sp.]
MSRLALLAALIALAPTPLVLAGRHPTVIAKPVPLDPADPGRLDLGRLTYLGGWVLRGGDRRFGGVSSMTFQGDRLVMLSDGGVVTSFRFKGSGPVADYAMSELPDGPGDGSRKVDRDSESSTYDPVSGHVWAGFETTNQIWRYTSGFAKADGHAAPAAMADWPGNEGAEAMARLRDGRFLVFAETKKREDGSHFALLFPGDPTEGAKPVVFGYRGPKGFAVTDAAQLPDGRVMLLHRRFSITAGFAAALTIIDPNQIRPGEDVTGEPVARLAPPLTVDNMEALAISQSGGRIIVWIASDDNYFVAERTLLLAFALKPGT